MAKPSDYFFIILIGDLSLTVTGTQYFCPDWGLEYRSPFM